MKISSWKWKDSVILTLWKYANTRNKIDGMSDGILEDDDSLGSFENPNIWTH